MNRARLSQILPLVLLVSAAFWAARAADSRGAAAPATSGGTYAVTFHIDAPSTVPDGAAIVCNARVTPRLSAFERLSSRAKAVQAVPGEGKVVGSSGECTVLVPLTAATSKARNGADLSYEIDAVTATGPVFSRIQQGIAVALPATGASAAMRMNVAF